MTASALKKEAPLEMSRCPLEDDGLSDHLMRYTRPGDAWGVYWALPKPRTGTNT